jgi:hypothetical protein
MVCWNGELLPRSLAACVCVAATLLVIAAPAVPQQTVPPNGLSLEWVYGPKAPDGIGSMRAFSIRGPIRTLRFVAVENAVIRISPGNRARVLGTLRYSVARTAPAHGQPPSRYVDHLLVLRAPADPGRRTLVGRRGSMHVWLVRAQGATGGAVEISGIPAHVWALSIRAKAPGGSFFSTAKCGGLTSAHWLVTAEIMTGPTSSTHATTDGGGDCSSG